MRGRKDVVWILVGAIVGTVSLAQGQTQVVPVIVASEPYNSDVMNRADRHGLLRKDDVTNTSLRVRKPGKSQVEPQCGSGGRGAIAETSVDSPKAICMRVAESASLDLDQAMRWIGRRTTLQGTEQGADALWFSPEPFGILPGTANSAIGSDYGVSAGTRTAINMDWIPGFNAQPVTPTPPPTPGGVPGPGVLGEAPPEPIRQLVPVWRVVPLLSVSERYDSNVFFAPKSSLVGLNAKPEDFVTTVNPQLAVVHSGRLMQGMLLGGTTSEVYIQNPDLNYTGYNGQVSMELAQAVQRMLPRARSLMVSDSILYTPQLPAFFQGGANFIGLGVPGQTSNIFGTGIQAFRINTFSNQGSVQGSYGLSPTTDFGVGYTHSILNFSGTFLGAGSQNQVFNTTRQTINAGPRIQLSPRDALNLLYTYTKTDQPGFGTYNTHTAVANWIRAISPALSSTITGGGTVFEELRQVSTNTIVVQSGTVFPNAGASLVWSGGGAMAGRQFGGPSLQGMAPGSGVSRSMMSVMSVPLTGGAFLPSGSTTVALTYSVGAFPSFLLSAGPILSQTVWIQASRGLTDSLGITGGVNYGRSAAAGQTGNFSFVSFSTNLALNYLITPTLRASLIHTFGNYKRTSGGINDEFDRQTAMFNLTYILGDNFLGLGALTAVMRPDSGGLEKR